MGESKASSVHTQNKVAKTGHPELTDRDAVLNGVTTDRPG